MLCEQLESALGDAAAGASPSAGLQAHLASCAVCRARLAAEQSLLDAIDSGLHATANAEVPAHVAASIRRHLSSPHPRKLRATPAIIPVAAAILVALVAAHEFRQVLALQHLPSFAATSAASAPAQPGVSPQNLLQAATDLPGSRSSLKALRRLGHNAPQVLVPRDQETLLEVYATAWIDKKHPPLALTIASEDLSPVPMAPIQIALLDVKSLADSESR